MDRNESLALYRRGRDAWNAWAMGMLIEGNDDDAPRWVEEATANFMGHEFAEDEHFQGFIFPGYVFFDKARFRGDIEFREATFKGLARFERTTFEDAALFDRAIFESDAWFANSAVDGSASFKETVFKGDAWFQGMNFGRLSQLVSLADGAMESRSTDERERRTADRMSDVGQELGQ